MDYEPTLRLRRRQPRILGNVLATMLCMVWVFAFLAWGFMPGPTEARPTVTVPQTVMCPDPTVLSDPNC